MKSIILSFALLLFATTSFAQVSFTKNSTEHLINKQHYQLDYSTQLNEYVLYLETDNRFDDLLAIWLGHADEALETLDNLYTVAKNMTKNDSAKIQCSSKETAILIKSPLSPALGFHGSRHAGSAYLFPSEIKRISEVIAKHAENKKD